MHLGNILGPSASMDYTNLLSMILASFLLQDNKRLYLQLLDLELSMQETNEEQVDKIFGLVKDSSLPEDIKEGFSQRHLEFLEDFSSNIVKITKAREMHSKLYKSKTSQGKKRANEEVYVFLVVLLSQESCGCYFILQHLAFDDH